MLDITAAGKSPAPKTVTTKHLAYELAEQHQLTKKQALEILEDLVGMVGQQKGSLPRHQGTQNGDLNAGRAFFHIGLLCDDRRNAPRRRNHIQRPHRQARYAARGL